MSYFTNLKETGATLQGKVTDYEKLGDQYRLTVNDDCSSEDVSFMVAGNLAEDILENRDATFRFTGDIQYDMDSKTYKRDNIKFKMTGFQMLDDMAFIEAIEKIRDMKIDLPHDFANNLIKERHEQ